MCVRAYTRSRGGGDLAAVARGKHSKQADVRAVYRAQLDERMVDANRQTVTIEDNYQRCCFYSLSSLHV